MCRDCERLEQNQKQENLKNWEILLDLVCRASVIRARTVVGKNHVLVNNHDMIQNVLNADKNMECPYFDILDGGNIIYIG